ncbi:MAG: GNAT family N-acetyltransferase [Pseudomonadales bacterium]
MIRRYEPADQIAVADLWHRAGVAEYTYLPTWQAFSVQEARRVFRDVIAARCEIWIYVSAGAGCGTVSGYLALDGDYLDRLYVDPGHQRRGVGSALLAHAKRLCPTGIRLHTHQANHRARAFYERNGFVVAGFGISPAPESAPDVAYLWRPESPE